MDNKQNYRTLEPWEEITLKHVSAIIGEIIGAGCSYSILMERISDMMLELSYWDTPNNDDNEINPVWNSSNFEESHKQDYSLPREYEEIPY